MMNLQHERAGEEVAGFVSHRRICIERRLGGDVCEMRRLILCYDAILVCQPGTFGLLCYAVDNRDDVLSGL